MVKKIGVLFMVLFLLLFGCNYGGTVGVTGGKNSEAKESKVKKPDVKKSQVKKSSSMRRSKFVSVIDKNTVQTKLGIKVKEVNPSPIPGISEIITDNNQVAYIDNSGRFFIQGEIFDLDKRINITQRKMEQITKVDFSQLPLKDAIKIGSGKRKIAVFHDPDCPYCRKLFAELKKIDDVEIYNFIFNLPIHPKAYEKSKKVYCATNPKKALEKAMAGDKLTNLSVCATNVVDRNLKLTQKIGVKGTPHMIFEDGTAIGGYRDASYIRNRLREVKIR